jgi:hypothetical protein
VCRAGVPPPARPWSRGGPGRSAARRRPVPPPQPRPFHDRRTRLRDRGRRGKAKRGQPWAPPPSAVTGRAGGRHCPWGRALAEQRGPVLGARLAAVAGLLLLSGHP